MKLTAIIVDDEPIARNFLERKNGHNQCCWFISGFRNCFSVS
jgi:hypothetical protein